MTTKNRLIEFLGYAGLSQNRFEGSVGLSTGYVNNLKDNVRKDTLAKISAVYPELNTAWLLTGEGEMLKSGRATHEPTPAKGLPLIPFDCVAGYGEDNKGIALNDCERYYIPEFENIGAEFIVRVGGSSMYPKYSSGDLLACRKIHDVLFFQWGKIYVIDSSQGQLIKRVFEHENPDLITLVSDNKEKYPPFPMPKSDIRSLSIVLGAVRVE